MNECNFYVTPRLSLRASGQFDPCDSTFALLIHRYYIQVTKCHV